MTITHAEEVVPRALQAIHEAAGDLRQAIAAAEDVRGAYLLWQDIRGLATAMLALTDDAAKKVDALMEAK